MFGHVIEGQEVVREVEGLQVDESSRPLVDVTVSSCGELVLQVRPKGMPVVLKISSKDLTNLNSAVTTFGWASGRASGL